mmetsp:Transcript_42678/g.49953  ORF Transcript_42678/g.49953 Transcript_42678/m.49953 type:complete len:116 (-) Transcript_42678:195-542(-)
MENNLYEVDRCYKPHDCLTVGYGIIGKSKDDANEYKWIHNIMNYFATENKLKYGKDVKMVSLGTSYEFKKYLDNNQNKTMFGVLFCTTDWVSRVNISNTTLSKYSKFEHFDFNVP